MDSLRDAEKIEAWFRFHDFRTKGIVRVRDAKDGAKGSRRATMAIRGHWTVDQGIEKRKMWFGKVLSVFSRGSYLLVTFSEDLEARSVELGGSSTFN